MSSMNRRVLLACLLTFAASTDCVARISAPKPYATPKTRNIVGGRKVLIVIPQTNILAAADDVDFDAAYFFGGILFGVLLGPAGTAINHQITQRAEEKIRPLRAALEGYEFETPMKAALLPAIESSVWVRAQDIETAHDAAGANIERVLDASNTRQMLSVVPSYYADHKFRNLVVRVDTAILVRQIPKCQYGSARLKSDYIPFRQTVRCIVYLPGSESGTADDNLARWSADHGRLARQALDLAVRRAGELFAGNLDGTEATIGEWTKRGDRKTETRALMIGWVIEKNGDSTLFSSARDNALNYIEIMNP